MILMIILINNHINDNYNTKDNINKNNINNTNIID